LNEKMNEKKRLLLMAHLNACQVKSSQVSERSAATIALEWLQMVIVTATLQWADGQYCRQLVDGVHCWQILHGAG
jgi:hypothetical protein